MLFDRPSSILVSNTQGFFEIEDEHLFLMDPFEQEFIQIMGSRMQTEDNYYPFLYLKSLFEGYHSLVIFACRDSSKLIAWQANHKTPIEYVSQFEIKTSDFKFLFCLTETPLIEVRETILRSSTNAPEWVREELYTHASSLVEYSGLEEYLAASAEYIQLPQIIFRPYVCAVNISINSLIDFIGHKLTRLESTRILLLYKIFITRLGNDFITEFSQIARYCILRELVCVVTGRHVVMDPFTWQHVLSDCTALCSTSFYEKYHLVKTRIIRYKSTLGHYFIERRGPGWLDISSSIILPNGFLIEIQTGQQWGNIRITKDEVKLVLEMLSLNPLPLLNEDKQFLISEVVSGDNLGHTLWNEVSGYVEFILICEEAGWRPDAIVAVLPSSNPSQFSKLGVRASFYPFIQKSLHFELTKVKKRHIVIDYLSSMNQQDLPSQFFVRNQVVSFRYPRVSKTVVRTICNDYHANEQSKIRIYKNIRFHNKAQTNIVECLQELFSQLKIHDDIRLHPENIELDLEFTDKVDDIINDITSCCNLHGVNINLHEGYELPELMNLVAASSISIVPIGSGAILPTWVFNKYTVLHSETAHLYQVSWWHLAGNSDPTRQYPIPFAAVQDDPITAGAAYSNYQIEPKVYAEIVIIALHKYVLSETESSSLIIAKPL